MCLSSTIPFFINSSPRFHVMDKYRDEVLKIEVKNINLVKSFKTERKTKEYKERKVPNFILPSY